MMITTKYAYALGDYLLLGMGIKPWSGDFTGTHYTVLYFGIISIIGLVLVKKYALEKGSMRPRNIFLTVITLLCLYVLLTNTGMKIVKSKSEGLMVMGLDSKDSSLSYRIDEGKYVEFEGEMELKNYSNNVVEFAIKFINPQYDDSDDSIDEFISIYNKNGKLAIFKFHPKECKVIRITLEEYILDDMPYDGSGNVGIDELILVGRDNREIRLMGRDFIGID